MMKSHETGSKDNAAAREPHKPVEQSAENFSVLIRGKDLHFLWLAKAAGTDVSKQAFLEPLIAMNKRHLTQPSQPHSKNSDPFLSFFSCAVTSSQRVCQHLLLLRVLQ
jgi:hypothetical protein